MTFVTFYYEKMRWFHKRYLTCNFGTYHFKCQFQVLHLHNGQSIECDSIWFLNWWCLHFPCSHSGFSR